MSKAQERAAAIKQVRHLRREMRRTSSREERERMYIAARALCIAYNL